MTPLGARPPADGDGIGFAVVGAGRVGRALVAAGSGAAGPFGRGFDGADHEIVVLAVPDREIAAAAALIAPRPGRLVGHCSGATTLEVLAPHERFGMHPLMTVAGTPSAGDSVLAGAPAAVAGSTARAAEIAARLARDLGMHPFPIRDADRAAYHAAASIASNFLVTLEDAAAEVLEHLALDREVLVPLVRTTVDNWAAHGRAALTGPVARGDEATVARQRAALEQVAPELVALFDVLVARTRHISGR